MEKYFDINKDKHSIRCKEYYAGNHHAIKYWIIATYGFGGQKDNQAIKKFAERITTKYKGFGVICFDWPCHGNDARNRFLLSECLSYLNLVNEYAKQLPSTEKIYNYSASMGAYFTLLYIHENGNPYERIALRCPAIQLGKLLYDQMTKEEKEKLDKKGEVKIGWARKIPITKDFLHEVRAKDITSYEYFDFADQILILHGTKDKTAPFEEAAFFADENVIELIPVENADHAFSNPDSMDFAIGKAIDFFRPINVEEDRKNDE